MKNYNGYTNRATWLTALHLGDLLDEQLVDDNGFTSIQEIEQYIRDYVYDMAIESIDSNSYVKDLLMNEYREIDFYQLAKSIAGDKK
jgi:hypothetical protein